MCFDAVQVVCGSQHLHTAYSPRGLCRYCKAGSVYLSRCECGSWKGLENECSMAPCITTFRWWCVTLPFGLLCIVNQIDSGKLSFQAVCRYISGTLYLGCVHCVHWSCTFLSNYHTISKKRFDWVVWLSNLMLLTTKASGTHPTAGDKPAMLILLNVEIGDWVIDESHFNAESFIL